MNLAVFIQCRLNSKRLPAKGLLKLSDTTILGMTVNRSVLSGYATYVLTSTNKYDDLVEREALASGASGVYRGALDDVQSRFLEAAKLYGVDYMARVTADNPLTEYKYLSAIKKSIEEKDHEHCSINPNFCPDGTNLEVFPLSILEKSRFYDTSSYNKEHVTPWIVKNTKKLGNVREHNNPDSYYSASSNYHLGIDTIDDYLKVSRLINFCESKYNSSWKEKDFATNCIDALIKGMIDYPVGRRYPI